MTDTLVYTTHQTSIGNLLVVASPRGLRYVTLLNKPADAEEKLRTLPNDGDAPLMVEAHGFLATACSAIDRYLTDGTPLSLPVDLAGGTPLQRMVWLEIARIPYGETISYTTLADRVGFPRAIRAVASACGANPVPLAIACHRILAKDGSLGGFSLGGVEVKEILLALEAEKERAAA
jgi:O-6-methylguanine DNA methyltransferase